MRILALAVMMSTWTIACRADEGFPIAQCMATIDAVFDAVLDHHVQPPTRQEMSLALLRYLNVDQSTQALAELSRQVSDISSKTELAELVRQQIASRSDLLKFDPDHLDQLQLAWLGSVVHGDTRLDSVKNADVQQQLAANRYVGIGVQMTKDKDGFVFRRVMENGAAARAGMRDNDVLLKVNDQLVEGSLSDVIDQMRGPEGSRLRLTIKSSADAPREIELVRQVVFIKTVDLEPLKPKETTAIINVQTLKASTLHELQTVLDTLPSYVREIQLNVRTDGNFHYLHLLADALMDQGVLGKLVMRDGTRTIETSEGNILGRRKLRVELADVGPQRLLSLMMLRSAMGFEEKREFYARVKTIPGAGTQAQVTTALEPVYLQESIPILDGRAVISLATRRFEMGDGE